MPCAWRPPERETAACECPLTPICLWSEWPVTGCRRTTTRRHCAAVAYVGRRAEVVMTQPRRRCLRAACLVAAIAVAGLSAVASSAASAQAPVGAVINPGTGLPIGALGMRAASPGAAVRPAATVDPGPQNPPVHLNYYGGAVLANAQVDAVLWGPGSSPDSYSDEVRGTITPNLDTFLAHVTNSAYFSWLREYSTRLHGGSNQTIGYASYGGRTMIHPSAKASTPKITDTEVAKELVRQLHAHQLPAPTFDVYGHVNTVYALVFPAEQTVCEFGFCSGIALCAYHSTVFYDGVAIPYMVIPDYNSAAAIAGCGSPVSTTRFSILESSMSHELVESVTDPDVGFVSQLGPPLGWYDPNYGEAADICVELLLPNFDSLITGTDGVGYLAQYIWSDSQNACTSGLPAAVATAPRAPTATANGGGRITVAWLPPAHDGGTAVTSYDVYESSTAHANGTVVATVTAPTTSWQSGPLAVGSTYYFRVRAHNIVGDSPLSARTSATATG